MIDDEGSVSISLFPTICQPAYSGPSNDPTRAYPLPANGRRPNRTPRTPKDSDSLAADVGQPQSVAIPVTEAYIFECLECEQPTLRRLESKIFKGHCHDCGVEMAEFLADIEAQARNTSDPIDLVEEVMDAGLFDGLYEANASFEPSDATGSYPLKANEFSHLRSWGSR